MQADEVVPAVDRGRFEHFAARRQRRALDLDLFLIQPDCLDRLFDIHPDDDGAGERILRRVECQVHLIARWLDVFDLGKAQFRWVIRGVNAGCQAEYSEELEHALVIVMGDASKGVHDGPFRRRRPVSGSIGEIGMIGVPQIGYVSFLLLSRTATRSARVEGLRPAECIDRSTRRYKYLTSLP